MFIDFSFLNETLVGWDENGELVPINYKDVVLNNSYIGFYFSGKWCPPCQMFTPKLISFYKAMKKTGRNLEIIFVSADICKEDFLQYYGTMPWLALHYDDTDNKSQLREKFSVYGFPRFVLLDCNGAVLFQNARSNVLGDPSAERFPWQ